MNENTHVPSNSADQGLFRANDSKPERPSLLPWMLAGTAVLLVVIVVFFTTRRKSAPSGALQSAAAYNSSITVTDLQMSESSALSGVKLTYIDGQIRNTGQKTLTGATAQVQFSNDEQLPPQLETVPVSVIRTHEPYIDTQSLSAAPLGPGQQREIRLIFENINSNWNQQLPVIRMIELSTR